MSHSKPNNASLTMEGNIGEKKEHKPVLPFGVGGDAPGGASRKQEKNRARKNKWSHNKPHTFQLAEEEALPFEVGPPKYVTKGANLEAIRAGPVDLPTGIPDFYKGFGAVLAIPISDPPVATAKQAPAIVKPAPIVKPTPAIVKPSHALVKQAPATTNPAPAPVLATPASSAQEADADRLLSVAEVLDLLNKDPAAFDVDDYMRRLDRVYEGTIFSKSK